MSPKYQVFISSTYEDMKHERDLVVKAILEMGHIPVGMEMFSAGDESQWKLIARTIEESDYYVVIVANRYGSTEPGTEISYTEKEYLHAESLGVPTLGFVIDSKASWPLDRQETDEKKREALRKFKDRVRTKICSKWDSGIDLAGKASIALSKQFVLNPRPGWVRASDAVTPQIANELSRLSEENSQLRRRVEESTRGVDSSKAAWKSYFSHCADIAAAAGKHAQTQERFNRQPSPGNTEANNEGFANVQAAVLEASKALANLDFETNPVPFHTMELARDMIGDLRSRKKGMKDIAILRGAVVSAYPDPSRPPRGQKAADTPEK